MKYTKLLRLSEKDEKSDKDTLLGVEEGLTNNLRMCRSGSFLHVLLLVICLIQN